MPTVEQAKGFVIRVNDGNDSNNNPGEVMRAVAKFPQRFYNTSIAGGLARFDAPVVLTINPAQATDQSFVCLKSIPNNLMFVRIRTNTWNLELVDQAVEYYSSRGVPVVLTFMAYYGIPIPAEHQENYSFRQRTLNSYWVITPKAWDEVMSRYQDNCLVFSCGKDAETFACKDCGNCLREYHATAKRLGAISSIA